ADQESFLSSLGWTSCRRGRGRDLVVQVCEEESWTIPAGDGSHRRRGPRCGRRPDRLAPGPAEARSVGGGGPPRGRGCGDPCRSVPRNLEPAPLLRPCPQPGARRDRLVSQPEDGRVASLGEHRGDGDRGARDNRLAVHHYLRPGEDGPEVNR